MVKEGPDSAVIEGHFHSGEHYTEAIECLLVRYDRLRLIHQAHANKILEAPILKEGSGKKILRHSHDTVQQHLRALKSMGYDSSRPFVTSAIELKLDTGTMFQWQKYSQEKAEGPHYRDLLELINLHAQASETSMFSSSRKTSGIVLESLKNSNTKKLVTA